MYFDSPGDWDRVVDGLWGAHERADAVGLDTEFYGYHWAGPNVGERYIYDPREISPIGRTRVHVWSVAVLLDQVTPRGFRKAVAAVLPESALDYPPLRKWLESPAVKCCHNLPSDAHTLGNHGVDLGGGRDTLAVARWCWPERSAIPKRLKPYALKTLARELLGEEETVSFEELLTEPNLVAVTKTVSRCVCTLDGCRKRKEPHGQYKVDVTEYVERGRVPVPLWTLSQASPLWERYVDYAASDAVWAVQLNDLARIQRREVKEW